MTQEDKELLLKDLSARLPYGVKLGFYASATKQTYICTLLGLEPQEDEPVIAKTENGSFYMLAGNVKPYLFPLSSMTEEQKKEFKEISKCEYEIRNDGGFDSEGVYLIEIGKYEYEYNIDTTIEEFYFNYEIINWLNKNHFDYIGLIDKGLAIDATGLNIY
jgi:hypothetical protein